MFACQFLHLEYGLPEVLDLFNIIDNKQDGFIDESEFSGIFKGIKSNWNSHEFEIMDSVLRDRAQAMKGSLDINVAANSTEKTIHNKAELFGHPHFSKVNANRSEVNSARRPKTSKTRTLSIVDKDGVSVSSFAQKPASNRDSNYMSEYSAHFKKSNSIHHKMSRITSAYA